MLVTLFIIGVALFKYLQKYLVCGTLMLLEHIYLLYVSRLQIRFAHNEEQKMFYHQEQKMFYHPSDPKWSSAEMLLEKIEEFEPSSEKK